MGLDTLRGLPAEPQAANALLRRFVMAFDCGLDSSSRYAWLQKRLGINRGAHVAGAYLAAVQHLRTRYTPDELGPTFPTCIEKQ